MKKENECFVLFHGDPDPDLRDLHVLEPSQVVVGVSALWRLRQYGPRPVRFADEEIPDLIEDVFYVVDPAGKEPLGIATSQQRQERAVFGKDTKQDETNDQDDPDLPFPDILFFCFVILTTP